jgi:hypothetical protein
VQLGAMARGSRSSLVTSVTEVGPPLGVQEAHRECRRSSGHTVGALSEELEKRCEVLRRKRLCVPYQLLDGRPSSRICDFQK